jgi:hypothetical protein
MAHETDYQRARRQRLEVKKHGVTGATPREALKRIAEHTNAKHKALKKRTKKDKVGEDPRLFKQMDQSLHAFDPK